MSGIKERQTSGIHLLLNDTFCELHYMENAITRQVNAIQIINEVASHNPRVDTNAKQYIHIWKKLVVLFDNSWTHKFDAPSQWS